MGHQMSGPDNSSGQSIRPESDSWGFQSPSGRDIYVSLKLPLCIENERCFWSALCVMTTMFYRWLILYAVIYACKQCRNKCIEPNEICEYFLLLISVHLTFAL